MIAPALNVHRLDAIGIAVRCWPGAMLLTSSPSAWLLWLPLALCLPVITLVQAHLGMAIPVALAGRANSAYNVQMFIGTFATRWGFGLPVDALTGHGAGAAEAFRITSGVAVALQKAALIFFALNRALPAEKA